MNKKGEIRKEDKFAFFLFLAVLIISAFFIVFMKPERINITGLAISPTATQATPTPSPEAPWCNGTKREELNIFEKSSCTNLTGTYTDRCSSTSLLVEYYCEANQCLKRETDCAALKTPTVCDKALSVCVKPEASGGQEDTGEVTDSSNGGSTHRSTGGSCVPEWNCVWTACQDNIQQQVCEEISACNTTYMPEAHGKTRACAGEDTSASSKFTSTNGTEAGLGESGAEATKKRTKFIYLFIGLFFVFIFIIIILLVLSKQKNTGGVTSSIKPTKKEIREVFGKQLVDIKE